VGFCAIYKHFLASSFLCSQTESTPTHQQVTLTVGQNPCKYKLKGEIVMKKSIQSVFFAFALLLVLLNGCAPASTPVPPTLTPIPPTATQTVTPSPVPTATPIYTYLSSLKPIGVELGWGKFSVGTFNFTSSEDNINLGDPIVIHGVEYPQGIFAHAPSRLVYKLENKFDEFNATIGLVESIICGDGVNFIIQLDGVEIYKSPTLDASSNPLEIQFSVSNGDELRLIVDDGPLSDDGCDWAIWGDPRLH
jgi:hypothetical protein